MDWGMGNGGWKRGWEWEKRFTFKPLIPPLISSAAFSPWAPVGLLVVVGVDMVVIKVRRYQVGKVRYKCFCFEDLVGWGCRWLAKGCR